MEPLQVAALTLGDELLNGFGPDGIDPDCIDLHYFGIPFFGIYGPGYTPACLRNTGQAINNAHNRVIVG